jgi:adenylate cyclase
MDRDVTFGHFRFEPTTGRLWAGTQEIRLTPKASGVLRQLVARAGTPVSKDELFASVWDGVTVSDDALTSCVQELRRALADDPRQPRFIETRHRRGYQFIATISQPSEPDVSAQVPAAMTIAVLPFADMSPNHDQHYLCDGLAEELINVLSQIDGLRVSARTASFQFRDRGADIGDIGKRLGVATLLEGSVRKAANRLRVVVQLIDVVTGYHRWSQRFDRTLDDVFAIQDEIAETVATRLRGGLLSHRERQAIARPHTAVAAYEYYLRARQHLPRMTRPDLERSGEFFQRAIDVDSAYAPAFAGLAMVHATLYEWFGARDIDLSTATNASARALELAPELAEAHVSRGCALSLSREYDAAAHAFEAAIALNPNLFDAYYYFARTMFACGEVARAAEFFGKAGDVRQDDFQSPILLSLSLQMLGQPDHARAARREGLRRAEHIVALNPLDGRALSLGSVELFTDGQTARALEWSQRSLQAHPDDPGVVINAACLRLRIGDTDQALDLLERAFTNGWGKRDWIEHDPDYDVVRHDPRFIRLLDKLK